MSFTNAQLAQQVADMIANWSSFSEEYSNWIGGTVAGGPNSDGEYPLTNWAGTETLLPCPAKLADDTTGYAATTQASADAAAVSETNASDSETAAATSETNAETFKDASAVSAAAASTSESNAQSSAVVAAAQAAAAAASAASATAIAESSLEVVSQVEAEAGTATDQRIWTAQRVAQAIAALSTYTVTQGDVTAHQAALSITESQISDLGAYITGYTVTQGDVTAHQAALAIAGSQVTSGTVDKARIDADIPRHVTAGYTSGDITVSASAPGTPAQGDIWFDTT